MSRGTCHQAGGGAPLQQINTRACVSTDRENESHPEGWKLPEIQTENANTELCQGGPCHQSAGGGGAPKTNKYPGKCLEEEEASQTPGSHEPSLAVILVEADGEGGRER